MTVPGQTRQIKAIGDVSGLHSIADVLLRCHEPPLGAKN
jgi:hypothetical protein